jgi:hypothetical protein
MASDAAYAFDDGSFSGCETYRSRDRRSGRATTATADSAAIADVLTVSVAIGAGHLRLDGVPPSSMPSVKRVADQLGSFSTLPQNWNSYNALPINQASLENAANLAFDALLSFGVEAQISPMSDGGVSLVLHRGEGECEIEVVGRNASVLISRANEEREHPDVSPAKAKMLLRDWLST